MRIPSRQAGLELEYNRIGGEYRGSSEDHNSIERKSYGKRQV